MQRLKAMLSLEGRRVSSITIQKILNDNGLRTRQDRWLGLEATADKALDLTAEQPAFLEKLNPCLRERRAESAAPSELWSADTFFVGSLKGVGRVYLHAVDTYGSYAFLHVSKQLKTPVAVLHNDVVPFYRRLKLAVTAVLTHNGREFCRTDKVPLRALSGPQRHRAPPHHGTEPQDQRARGASHWTVLEEFFRVTMHEKFYDSVEALQQDLDAWLPSLPHRTASSWVPKPETKTLRIHQSVRQAQRLSGQLW